jgi:hypothetical protein
VVAVACGDVDGDSSLEIALVGRRKIQLGRVRAHRFEPFAETTWASLAPVSSAPLREPIAAASVFTGRGLLVGSTDRENGLWLSPALARTSVLGPVLPVFATTCVARAGTALGALRPCFSSPAAAPANEDVGADVVAGGMVVDGNGQAHRVMASRSATTGDVTLTDDQKHALRVVGRGYALAVADLDLDGKPELVTSLDTLAPDADALVVSTWETDGALRERLRLPVPGGIRAVATCPPEEGGVSPIVVVTSSALWVVR